MNDGGFGGDGSCPPATSPLRTLLIANRGEIAIRIARTAAEMGIATVAVFPQDDAAFLHVRYADTAHALSGSGPAAYLDTAQIVAACRAHGADAMHLAAACGVSVLPGTAGPTTLEAAHDLVDQARVHLVRHDSRVGQQALEEVDVGLRAGELECGQRTAGLGQRRRPAAGVGEQLGEQAVVACAGAVAGIAEAVHPDTRARRRLVGGQHPIGRARLSRLRHGFQVDAHLHRHATRRRHFRLGQVHLCQARAAGDLQLQPDEVEPRHRLSLGVLHLEPCIGLDERVPVPARLHQELDRAQAAIARRTAERHRLLEQPGEQSGGQRVGGRHLHLLLPLALQAALTVSEVRDFGAITQDLHLHVSGTLLRIEGRAVGLICNNPQHLGGAIDAEASDKAARFMQLCEAFDIPILSLSDTLGNMVGHGAEKTGLIRHSARLFVIGANLTVPRFSIILRKSYGVGAIAMTGGSYQAAMFSVSWPTGEFGAWGWRAR